MPIRKPIVSGQFYRADFENLNKEIESSFLHRLGSGELPKTRNNNKIILGGIAPHAGYFYSGACQAFLYKEIAESKFPQTFIILGTNHTGSGNDISMNLDDWETPFGLIKTDQELGNRLLKNKLIKNDPLAHLHEHSIEVQLPFLQYANKQYLKDLKFIPITIKPLEYEIYKELAYTLSKLNDIIIIASSDFTHYGPSYGFTPFVYNKKESLYKFDRTAIDLILNLDLKGFLNYIKKTRATICGYASIAILIQTMKLKKAKPKLLQYYTSGDISKDYTNAVGYASIIFER